MTQDASDHIEIRRFSALNSGAHLVVLGAVHGNERCGTEAIRRLSAELEAGSVRLTHGTLTLVPICNPRAYAQGVRFCERNLNRYFYPKDEPEHYEDFIDPILCRVLDEADALLDLHSYQSQGEAFCFLGTTSAEEIAFARALKVETYIHGWADAFSRNATPEQRRASMGTTDYTRANGRGAVAVTLECGHHQHPLAAEMGYTGIRRAMAHLGMCTPYTPPAGIPDAAFAAQHAIAMRQVVYQEKPGALVQPWQHAQRVAAGEVIARYDDGQEVRAPFDAVLVLPKTSTDHAIGSEWFYIGEETSFPLPAGAAR